jgi:DNA-3-methyladenine glycosylase II
VTPAEYARARRLLMRRDPILGAAIKRIGPCGMAERQRSDHLTALVGAIVSQQLSTRAAATIFGRVMALVPEGEPLSAAQISGLSDAALRGAGLSGQKVGYLRDLCARILDGRLQLDELEALADEAVVERLVAVKGFGRWTAEMFLMFRLHRPDVLPVGDLGIVNAVKRLYRLRKTPAPKRLLQIGEAWRPYRSVASWYLWQTLREELPIAPQGKPKTPRPEASTISSSRAVKSRA